MDVIDQDWWYLRDTIHEKPLEEMTIEELDTRMDLNNRRIAAANEILKVQMKIIGDAYWENLIIDQRLGKKSSKNGIGLVGEE